MKNILCNTAARLPWTALALLVCALASPSSMLAQIPDVTETEKPQPVSNGQTQSMFELQVANKLWVSGQINFIFQTHPPFDAKYTGPNSLQPDYEKATSRVMTLYTGYRFNGSTETLVDIEEAGGQGLSTALGIAGFANLDVVRNPTLSQSPYIARAMFHGVVALSKDRIEGDPSPLSTFSELPVRRLEVRVGKFGIVDFFDVNSVGSDSHMQFMNWAIDQNGAYDFAADTRGYTWGAILEFQDRKWGFRFAEALMPTVANGIDMQWNFRRARGESYEFQLHRGVFPKKDGEVRLLAYTNYANMGIYRVAIDQYLEGKTAKPDITNHPVQTTLKYGFGVNLEQALTPNVTAYGRFGWNNGKTESYAFTEIDQSFAGGIFVNGRKWGRAQDRFGIAAASNAISGDHRRYLALSGVGFIIGDGALNYGRENILESYYTVHVWKGLYVAPDVQYIVNPAYNRDRGPVVVPGFRLHIEL
jgi:high affinity Mn2+ porin